MNTPKVTIIDYGVGNLLSVQRALEYCGASVTLSADREQILSSQRVVLPGVGAFGNAMQALQGLGLVEVIRELDNIKTPLLGICLGMQLLLEESEEFGSTLGLGLIPGRVISVPSQTISGEIQKIPHIGWSALEPSNKSSGFKNILLQDIRHDDAVYFVHSFMAAPADPSSIIAHCNYGGHMIPAVIERDKIIGCQFHPEKSGGIGLNILKRFCEN